MEPLGYVVVGVPVFLIVFGTIGGLICRQRQGQSRQTGQRLPSVGGGS